MSDLTAYYVQPIQLIILHPSDVIWPIRPISTHVCYALYLGDRSTAVHPPSPPNHSDRRRHPLSPRGPPMKTERCELVSIRRRVLQSVTDRLCSPNRTDADVYINQNKIQKSPLAASKVAPSDLKLTFGPSVYFVLLGRCKLHACTSKRVKRHAANVAILLPHPWSTEYYDEHFMLLQERNRCMALRLAVIRFHIACGITNQRGSTWHCHIGRSISKGKRRFSTSRPGKTNEYFGSKLGRRDYVGKIYTKFGADRLRNGASTWWWNITILWLSSPVIFSVFSPSPQVAILIRIARLMAQK